METLISSSQIRVNELERRLQYINSNNLGIKTNESHQRGLHNTGAQCYKQQEFIFEHCNQN